METLQRSLVKTIVWRIVATIITFMTVFAFTGAFNKSTTITLVAAALLAVGYYFNERIWDKIEWGRRHPLAVTQNESFESVQ
jgi:uncharacterized membrane protein